MAVTKKTSTAQAPADTAPADATAQPVAQPSAPPAAPAAKRRYQVGAVPIHHDGQFYDVGAGIALTDAEAASLDGLLIPINE
ncbi:MAG: hypothetical protein JSS18_01260 [Proteobacteria bacterium]|nr:hypothetical protein [Pseudomonadota bacterium]